MNFFSRYLIYLVDCAVMLAVVGVQLFIFRGEWPFSHHSDNWMNLLMGGHHGVYFTTLIGAAIYWTIVDFDPKLTEYRRSRVRLVESGEVPKLCVRFVRSLIKSFTMFGGGFLLLFSLFGKEHRFLHDRILGTERVKE